MGTPAVAEVVLVPFPYADLSRFKKRPALVISEAEFGNFILCQITSKSYSSRSAIRLDDADFRQGGLKVVSYIRPDRLFTVDQSVITERLGQIKIEKFTEVQGRIRQLFT